MTIEQTTLNSIEARNLVIDQFTNCIAAEGYVNAKKFLEECRNRQYSPSIHLPDYNDFLEAGKEALRRVALARLYDELENNNF